MEVNKLLYKSCSNKQCLAAAEFEFTDIENYEKPKTITLGYSCDNHFEQIQKELNAEQKSKTEKKK